MHTIDHGEPGDCAHVSSDPPPHKPPMYGNSRKPNAPCQDRVVLARIAASWHIYELFMSVQDNFKGVCCRHLFFHTAISDYDIHMLANTSDHSIQPHCNIRIFISYPISIYASYGTSLGSHSDLLHGRHAHPRQTSPSQLNR